MISKDSQTKVSLFGTLPFYPGGIWVKRALHLAAIFAIGLNLFLNQIQDIIIHKIDASSMTIASLADSIRIEKKKIMASTLNDFDQIQWTIEELDMTEFEDDSWSKWFYDVFAYYAETPDSEALNKVIRKLKENKSSLEAVNADIIALNDKLALFNQEKDEINQQAQQNNLKSMNINREVRDINNGLRIILKIVEYTSFLMWIPILISLLWLYFDLRYGDAKRTVLIALLIAIPFNIFVYMQLNLIYDESQRFQAAKDLIELVE